MARSISNDEIKLAIEALLEGPGFFMFEKVFEPE